MSSNNYSIIPLSSSSADIELRSHAADGKSPEEEEDQYPLIGGGGGGKTPAEGSSVSAAVFNLATSIIGAGIMALPATMKVLGVAVGFASIVVMGILSEISIELLVRFAVHCKSLTYGEVVRSALGRTPSIVLELCVIINNAGILIVYLIIIGDVMSGSPNHEGVLGQLLGHGAWDDRRLIILVVLVAVLAPLCVLEKIDSLSLTSAASVALAVVFVIVSCAIALLKLAEGQIRAPRMGPSFGSKAELLDLLVVIPIMTNAYVCHFNVQPIYNELEGKTPQKMYRVGRISTLLCTVVYALTAVSGYLLFGDDTESDVLVNFDKDLGIKFSSALNYIVRIGYVLHLVLVFPVVHFSLRRTVGSLAFPTSGLNKRWKTLGLTAALLALIYLGSTMIPNIWIAFKFTGATTGLALGFIFPSLIALRLDKQQKCLQAGERAAAFAMLGVAAVASLLGVIGNIYSIKNQSEG